MDYDLSVLTQRNTSAMRQCGITNTYTRMKQSLLAFCFAFLGIFFIHTSTNAQNWLVPGDRWRFHLSGGFAGFDEEFDLFITGDTTVGGRVCQKIRSSWPGIQVIDFRKVAYATSDKVFVWMPTRQQFDVQYDMSLSIGDSISIFNEFDATNFRMRYRVAAKGTIMADGQMRRFQDVHVRFPNQPWSTLTYKIIEGIGFVGNPASSELNCSFLFLDEAPFCQAAFDGFNIVYRCFASTSGVYAPGSSTCAPTSTQSPDANWSLKIWPNPAQDYLNVEMPDVTSTASFTIQLVTPIGQLVRTWKTNNRRFPIHDLPNGTYFLNIRVGESSRTEKVVVIR
jgi:hypothetical protein